MGWGRALRPPTPVIDNVPEGCKLFVSCVDMMAGLRLWFALDYMKGIPRGSNGI